MLRIAKYSLIPFVWWKGSEKNIFKRIIGCCDKFKADHFVRITGDNPLTDIKTLKRMTKIYFKKSKISRVNQLPSQL